MGARSSVVSESFSGPTSQAVGRSKEEGEEEEEEEEDDEIAVLLISIPDSDGPF